MKSFSSIKTGSAVAMACSFLLLSACSESSTKEGDKGSDEMPRNASTQKSEDSTDLRLPLDKYLLTADEQKIISQAREALIKKCMTRLGAQYEPTEQEASPEIGNNERRYGLNDIELAKESGYHLPGLDQQPSENYSKTILKLLRGGIDTYKGVSVPAKGCLGEAQGELNEVKTQESLQGAQDLNVKSYQESQKDPAVIAAFKEWSKCMNAAGHKYTDPIAAINDKEFSTSKPGEHERKVAVADVLCKEKVNIISIWSSVESTYQMSLIKENSRGLEEGENAKLRTIGVANLAISK
ncbi:hypothetical protein [Streptomyces sp. NBC_00989]|uniref:hypothetical protein n=1 Tax=Streptomyces sp. NBC_00989 TaxID=2903705 RepID=UPI00386F90FD|nr:hypothetical protein OG714_25105 [Streptomyces sp. NBC_00989]